MRNIYLIMKQETAQAINDLQKELLGISVVKKTDEKTGEIVSSVKCEVEISKGQGKFSRCQFSVKIPDTTKLKVTPEELETADYEVFFEDLEISFIDSRGNVFFRSSAYSVEKLAN